MRIPGDVPKITGIYGSQKINKIRRSGGAASKKDVLSISNEAKDFQTVLRALREVPDIRKEKGGHYPRKHRGGPIRCKST